MSENLPGLSGSGQAATAQAELRADIREPIFEVPQFDVSDHALVGAVLAGIGRPIDDLAMNAGGSSGQTPLAISKAGDTGIFASKILGHVALLDGLLKAGQFR